MEPRPLAHSQNPLHAGGSGRRLGAWRISLTGEIDLARKADLDAAVAAFGRSRVADADLDLAGVDFMDSTGLGAVLQLCRIARERGGTLRLLAPTRRVRRALEVSGVSPLCEITD